MVTASQDMHPEDIKAALRKAGHSLAGLAARQGVSRQAMTKTLTYPNARNEKLIARLIGKPVHHIWPSRYCADGARKRPQPSTNYRSSYRFAKRLAVAA